MDINELRAEVRRRQQAAQRKVNRLRNKGVDVAGTVHDVRRDPGNIAKYNTRQLNSYLGQLNAFTDRRNAFVGGVQGKPIPRTKWNDYKRTERAYQKAVNAQYEGVRDIFIPAAGKTVEGFDNSMRRTRHRGKGGAIRPFENMAPLEPHEVVDAARLDKLRDNLSRKLQKGYLPKELKKQRYQMMQAVTAFGDDELTAMAKSLTDDQFDTFWNYTDAPRDMYSGYKFLELLSTGKADEAQASIHEDATDETRQWLEWAQTLPNRKNRR